MKKKNCYIYTRVSTSMQVDGFSLDAQKEKLRRYAEFQDFVIAGEYSDEGKSGKTLKADPNFKLCLTTYPKEKTMYNMCWCSNCPDLAEMQPMCLILYN